jgi:hypothetical protein
MDRHFMNSPPADDWSIVNTRKQFSHSLSNIALPGIARADNSHMQPAAATKLLGPSDQPKLSQLVQLQNYSEKMVGVLENA